MYDVIVIGAGPAGCIAAKRTVEAGYNVLLVERMQVPREKSCSGILIKKSIKMVESEFGKIPDTILCRPYINRGIIIKDEDNHEFRFENEGLNVWRSSFDHWLALKAKNAGVEFRPSTSAISCEEKRDHVIVKLQSNETYYEKAKSVIACDGASSTVKKNLLKTTENYIFTYQTFCRGTINLDSEFFHAFLHFQLSEYDAWFNVKDDFLIFGVGVKETAEINKYHSKFLSFLRSHYNAKIESGIKGERGIIPCVTPGCPVDLGKGRVLLAGEAAGFLNPIGEGISSALASGYAAAEAIKSIYTKNKEVNVHSLLKAYENNITPERQYMIRQWKLLGRISPKFSYFNRD